MRQRRGTRKKLLAPEFEISDLRFKISGVRLGCQSDVTNLKS